MKNQDSLTPSEFAIALLITAAVILAGYFAFAVALYASWIK